MDLKFNKLKIVLIIVFMLASTALIFIWLKCNETTETFVPQQSIPQGMPAPRSILKKSGTLSIPKNVKFVEEFDLVNARNIPTDPWFQADPVTKYDPKFVNVFDTTF